MFRTNSVSLVFAGALALSGTFAFGMGGRPPADDEAANARIAPVAHVEIAGAAGTAAAAGVGSRSGEVIFKTYCNACHGTGPGTASPPNVPKVGDKAAWAPRIGVGLDMLVKSAKAGKNAMPPKGGSDATDEELARAIAYMADQSGANFKAPAAGEKIAGNERSGEQIAKTVCLKCHETGEKGAPKISDKAAWTQRGSKGIDALTTSVIRGHGNMPARGGLADLTDPEVKSAIAYLFKQVGSDLK
ncbi:MAG: c-type cytochrome [Rhodocyclaceae bacterium]|nr:c-type cytochrome [Rhodocyclaceae bacterium]